VIDNYLKLWELNMWTGSLGFMPSDMTVWEVPHAPDYL
jgi:hypothetical protein